MTLIADTGPIIALAKIKRLDLLQLLFDKVQTPNAVFKELMAKKIPVPVVVCNTKYAIRK